MESCQGGYYFILFFSNGFPCTKGAITPTTKKKNSCPQACMQNIYRIQKTHVTSTIKCRFQLYKILEKRSLKSLKDNDLPSNIQQFLSFQVHCQMAKGIIYQRPQTQLFFGLYIHPTTTFVDRKTHLMPIKERNLKSNEKGDGPPFFLLKADRIPTSYVTRSQPYPCWRVECPIWVLGVMLNLAIFGNFVIFCPKWRFEHPYPCSSVKCLM